MSGIIGGAGSKSGVIGETELDYEEGTWTPQIWLSGNDLGAGDNVEGRYVKTGNLVWLVFHWYKPSISSTGTVELRNLPFSFRHSADGVYQSLTAGYCRHSNGNFDLDGARFQFNTSTYATLYASDASHAGTYAVEMSGQGHLITTSSS